MRLHFHIALLLLLIQMAAGQTNTDWWHTNEVPLPVAGTVISNQFASLRVEAVSDQLQVTWTPAAALPEETAVSVLASADPIGHWPARDWRAYPLRMHGSAWQGNIPVESLDIPMAYFVIARSRNLTNVSPLRVCRPRAVGLELPSKLFWPFLEGFEQGLESWRLIGGTEPLQTSTTAKNGRNALSIRLPTGKRSATVACTRCRGWQIEERGATALAFWAKTKSGAGQLRCALVANAFTTNQLTAQLTNTFPLTAKWNRFVLPFAECPTLLLSDLDLVTFEFISASGSEFLLDDLYLLGKWRFD